MNKTERQLAIILELQRNTLVTAEMLSSKLGMSMRTIYRDIQSLSESGVPIVAATGVGYSLMEGYFLPSVHFSEEEAVSLLIGTEFIQQRFDDHYSQMAKSSQEKIEHILPQPIRNKVKQIRQNIRLQLYTENAELEIKEKAHLQTIRTAMIEKKKIYLNYSKSQSEQDTPSQSVRTVCPLGLIFVQGTWMLIAICELRGAIRHFRVSRMISVVATDDLFEEPIHFNIHDYEPIDNRHIDILVVFDLNKIDEVKESNNYFIENGEVREDGYYVHFRVRHFNDLFRWILSWGSSVVIIEPEIFKLQVQHEIENMLKRY